MNGDPPERTDFTVVMIPYFAEVIAADISDHIRMLRFDAMKRVQNYAPVCHCRKEMRIHYDSHHKSGRGADCETLLSALRWQQVCSGSVQRSRRRNDLLE